MRRCWSWTAQVPAFRILVSSCELQTRNQKLFFLHVLENFDEHVVDARLLLVHVEGVVHRLEMVQIHIQQGQPPAVAVG